ncbi:transposase (fragment) [Sphingomonas aurantiaca]|uniref:Transposase n=1 Tax=Sphingomonas aurantiaca TaxID=185949 RepID=A0A5E8AEV5_9SPHN
MNAGNSPSDWMRNRGTLNKTLYNRWKRWGERGVFFRIMEGLAAASATPKTIMIDATYLKAHRTASSLRVKRMARPVGKRFVSDVLSSLRKRIRPSNTRSLAKMEIRASWSS